MEPLLLILLPMLLVRLRKLLNKLGGSEEVAGSLDEETCITWRCCLWMPFVFKFSVSVQDVGISVILIAQETHIAHFNMHASVDVDKSAIKKSLIHLLQTCRSRMMLLYASNWGTIEKRTNYN